MTVPAGQRTTISSSERLVVVGGVGLAVASIVPWYTPGEFAFDQSRTNGWQDPDAVLSQAATVLGVAVAVAVVVAASQGRRPRIGSLSWGTVLTVASGVVFGLVALKFCLNFDNTTVGVYLALVASATQLYGAYVTRLTEASEPEPGGGAGPAPRAAAGSGPVVVDAWPETAYLLSQWLRPGTDPTAAVAAYRQAFAGDPGRQQRLVAELRGLLDPARGEAERTAVVAAHAPHLAGPGGTAVFEWLAGAIGGPPP